jgi:hypothetical protein
MRPPPIALVVVLGLAGCRATPPGALQGDAPRASAAPSDADSELEARTREVILAHRPELRACYDRELAKTPDLAGRVVLVVDVAQNGRAAHVFEARREGLDDEVVRCLAHVLRTIPFHDGAARTIRIQVPFAFSQLDPAPAP